MIAEMHTECETTAKRRPNLTHILSIRLYTTVSGAKIQSSPKIETRERERSEHRREQDKSRNGYVVGIGTTNFSN